MRKPALLLGIALALALYALCGTVREPKTLTRPPPAPPEEGCRLLGRVLDADGAPVSGAAVRARILSPGVAHEAIPAVTEDDGTFSLRLFPARGQWTVLVQPAGRPGFFPGTPVTAVPDETIRITIRESHPPEVEPEPPNVVGEVYDSFGRLLTGIRLLATTGDGTVLERAVSGERGRFEMRLTTVPAIIRLEATDKGSRHVETLPCDDLALILATDPPKRGEITLDYELTEALPNENARIRIYDGLGQMALEVWRPVREGPHRLLCDYGPLDIRVDAAGHAGAVQGFDFRPDHEYVTVRLTPAGRVRGRLSRPVRCFLFSLSPTLTPVCRSFRESDGVHQILRGLWDRMPESESFSFEGLPAGRYRLRFGAEGCETVERTVRLKPAEDLDLGLIDVEEATASVRLTLTDRDPPLDRELEFGYRVLLYENEGQLYVRKVPPGPLREVVFTGVPAGLYHYRVERLLDGENHTRRVGWDTALTVKRGADLKRAVDLTWRYGVRANRPKLVR